MPKLEKLLDNITSIESRLAGKDAGLSAADMRALVADSMRNGSGETASLLSFRMEETLMRLLKAFAAEQNEVRKQVVMAVRDMVEVLNQNDKVLDKRLSAMDKALTGAKDGLSSDMSKSGKGVLGAIQGVSDEQKTLIGRLEKMVANLPQSFPEPQDVDLSLVERMITELPNHIKVEKPKVEWQLDIERDVNGRIQTVIAHPVDAA